MAKSKIIIVDKDDNVIGHKEREEIGKEEIYRVSALWITNSKGEILLAQRHRTRTQHPLKWGPAAAGTLEEGETYDSNIVKEAEEEIGLKGINPEKKKKVLHRGTWIHFTQWYSLELDKDISDFKIQEDEVEQLKWFSKEELVKRLKESPSDFVGSTKEAVGLFLM